MIARLTGSITHQESNSLILETGGVGYELQVANSTSQKFQKGQTAALWIYTHVREDCLELFAFIDLKEKQIFLYLLKVKGIGPKMALLILSACSLDQFIHIIQTEDLKALCSLPKVGKKTAQYIILSLKDKFSNEFSVKTTASSSQHHKLVMSLEHLGFNHAEIQEALKSISLTQDFQKNLKQALSLLKS